MSLFQDNCSMLPNQKTSAGGHHPGHKAIDAVDEEEAKKHVGFVVVELFDSCQGSEVEWAHLFFSSKK